MGWQLPAGKGGKRGHLTIVQSLDPWGNVDHVLHIPTGMIVELRHINLADATKISRKGSK